MILAIDTAGFACSVALVEGDQIIAERHEVIQRGHAERLVPLLAELPGGGRADEIVIGCGPGSFTGVRVGIAAGRALGLAWGVKVSGCGSLALLAAEYLADHPALTDITVVVEGGHGEVFIQDFGESPGVLSSVPYDAAARLLAGRRLVGNAAPRFGAPEDDARHARAAAVRLLAPEQYSLPPSPVYGRGADAKPMA